MTIFEQLRAGVTTSSAKETQTFAIRFAEALPANSTLALHGDLGVGKTTFVQGLAIGLGVSKSITSPTFNLFNLHPGRRATLIHLDAYRLTDSAQLDEVMLEDFLIPPFCLAIEWPENIAAWLPVDTWHFDLGIAQPAHHTLRLR